MSVTQAPCVSAAMSGTLLHTWPPAIEEADEMKILESKALRAAGIALPLLMTGCAIVPDGGVVYSPGYRVPAYSANHYSSGYYSTYGSGYYPRPSAPPVYISRPAPPPAIIVRPAPPPAVIVRPAPAPVVVLPAPRPPGHGHRDGDRSYSHGGHGGSSGHGFHGGHGGNRSDHDRGGRGGR